ncbi:MAG: hypothetical protein ACR5KV_06135 [Wolbachia sp.]
MIISRANEVIINKSIIQKQEMLNEIAGRAASYKERDSKKKDLELLVICNRGEFQDKLSLPTDLGFLEIERLYKDMLSIKFREQGEFESHGLCEKLPLLKLEEIKEAFLASIAGDILKNMEKNLNDYVK